MRDKVLLGVVAPATGGLYEFRVPLDVTVEEAARMISELIAERDADAYEANSCADLVLIDPRASRPGEMLNPRDLVRVLLERGVLADGSLLSVV